MCHQNYPTRQARPSMRSSEMVRIIWFREAKEDQHWLQGLYSHHNGRPEHSRTDELHSAAEGPRWAGPLGWKILVGLHEARGYFRLPNSRRAEASQRAVHQRNQEHIWIPEEISHKKWKRTLRKNQSFIAELGPEVKKLSLGLRQLCSRRCYLCWVGHRRRPNRASHQYPTFVIQINIKQNWPPKWRRFENSSCLYWKGQGPAGLSTMATTPLGSRETIKVMGWLSASLAQKRVF